MRCCSTGKGCGGERKMKQLGSWNAASLAAYFMESTDKPHHHLLRKRRREVLWLVAAKAREICSWLARGPLPSVLSSAPKIAGQPPPCPRLPNGAAASVFTNRGQEREHPIPLNV